MKLRILVAIVAALALTAGAAACARAPVTDTVDFRLNDTVTAVELSQRLPLAASFDDRMGTAQIARLETPLSIRGTEAASGYRVGDIAYWASEQSIVVFLSDGTSVPSSGLVLIGRIGHGLARISDCTQRCTLQISQDSADVVQP